MSRVIVRSNHCFIEDEPDIGFIRLLDDELSFRVRGAEHTRAFKGYVRGGQFVRWDGIQRILSRDLSFPYGLLERVKRFYSERNRKLEIVNENMPKSPRSPLEINAALKRIDKVPRPYQLDILDSVKEHDCGIIRAATGSGKTLVSAMMVAHFGKFSIIYVIGKDLLHQTHAFFKDVFDKDVGIIGDGICEIRDINIASVWTIGQAMGLRKSDIILDVSDGEKALEVYKYKSILDMMKIAKVHVFDECHLAACDTIQAISRNINPEHAYGMSASPWRDDGKDMLIEAVFGSTIVDISASYLIKRGYLVKPMIKFEEVPKFPTRLEKQYQKVYSNYVVENPDRNARVVNGAVKLVELGYQPLVSYTRLKHGKYLYSELSKKIPCVLLSGKDSSKVRIKAKRDLESGKINCILASSIFDMGVDLPSLSGLVIAGGGKSSVRALQRIGRVIRPFTNKRRAAVLDFLDNAHYLKQHSKTRKDIYLTEEEFDVRWPE